MIQVNWLAVVGAALLGFLLGGLWYSPVLCGKAWVRAHGFSEEQIRAMRKGVARKYALAGVCLFLMAYALARIMVHWQPAGLLGGLTLGLLIWFGFAMATGLMTALFSAYKLRAFVIDTGYQLVCLLVMGGLLAVWR